MAEYVFQTMCEAQGLPRPEPEWPFAKLAMKRNWQFDWAFIEHKVALEQEGGVWVSGRHNHPVGFQKDMEKYNAAAILGWRVLRATPQMFKSGEVFDLLSSIFNGKRRVV